MEDANKKDRFILVLVISLMLIAVIFISCLTFYLDKSEDKNNKLNLKVQQIYTSDYKLVSFNEDFYYGITDDKINLIIDKDGKERYFNEDGITFDEIYETVDGRYIIYNNEDNNLNVFVYDNQEVKKLYSIKKVSYIKPIIFLDGNKKFIVGFSSYKDNDLYLYGLENSGIVVLEDTLLIGDIFKENKYYIYNKDVLIVKNKKGYYGAINKLGEEVIAFKYQDLVGTVNNNYVGINKKGKYGIIDENGKTLLDFKYNLIIPYKKNYLVSLSNKLALFDEEYSKISNYGIVYDTKKDYSLHEDSEIKMYTINDKSVIFSNILNSSDKNMFVISDGKIIFTKKQNGVGINENFYSYDNKVINIYDENFNIARELVKKKSMKNILNVYVLQDEIIEVEYLNSSLELKNAFYDKDGEIIKNSYGRVVLKNDKYYIYLKEKEKMKIISFVSYEGELLKEITGEYVSFGADFIIVDYGIYKIEIS